MRLGLRFAFRVHFQTQGRCRGELSQTQGRCRGEWRVTGAFRLALKVAFSFDFAFRVELKFACRVPCQKLDGRNQLRLLGFKFA